MSHPVEPTKAPHPVGRVRELVVCAFSATRCRLKSVRLQRLHEWLEAESATCEQSQREVLVSVGDGSGRAYQLRSVEASRRTNRLTITYGWPGCERFQSTFSPATGRSFSYYFHCFYGRDEANRFITIWPSP